LFTTGTSVTRRSFSEDGLPEKWVTEKKLKATKVAYAEATATKRKGRLQTGD